MSLTTRLVPDLLPAAGVGVPILMYLKCLGDHSVSPPPNHVSGALSRTRVDLDSSKPFMLLAISWDPDTLFLVSLH